MANWKKLLVSGSNISELNNDAGYLSSLNGTGVFSGSAQVALGGVLGGTADAATFTKGAIYNDDINNAAAIDYTKINFAGSDIVSGSVDLSAYTTTASFNAYTSSTDSSISSLTSTVATQGSDLFALTGTVNTLSSDFTTTSGSLSTRVTDLENFSSSLNSNFVSEGEFGTFTSSYYVDSASVATKLDGAAYLADSQTFTGFNTFSEVTTLAGVTMTSGLDVNGQVVINVPTPVNGQDAANKNYVDNGIFNFSQSIAPELAAGAAAINNLSNDLYAVSSSYVATSASLVNRISADEAKYDAYTSSFTTSTLIVTSAASVTGSFGVQGDASFAQNVIVEGNLTVNGTASFVNVEELSIKDKFITLASGSNSLTDSGIIFQSTTSGVGSGPSLFLEATSTGAYGRMAMATSVDVNATAATPAAYVNTTEIGDTALMPADPTFGGSTNGFGNMYIDPATGDIFIYS